MSEQHTDDGQWQVVVDTPRDVYGSGPTWRPAAAAQSLHRINQAGDPAKATAQAAAESVMILHSMRRILMGALVVAPIVVGVLTFILVSASN